MPRLPEHYIAYLYRHPIAALLCSLLTASSLVWLASDLLVEHRVGPVSAAYAAASAVAVVYYVVVPTVRIGMLIALENQRRVLLAHNELIQAHAEADARAIREKKTK